MLSIKGIHDRQMVILEKGQKLVEALTHLASEQGLKGGAITGIGALTDVELGYYELHDKTYLRKTFSETDYELISMNGNISLKEGVPFVHVHACLGGPDFQTFGGHLFEATVAVTAEITITPLGVMPKRAFDDCIGLALIADQERS